MNLEQNIRDIRELISQNRIERALALFNKTYEECSYGWERKYLKNSVYDSLMISYYAVQGLQSQIEHMIDQTLNKNER